MSKWQHTNSLVYIAVNLWSVIRTFVLNAAAAVRSGINAQPVYGKFKRASRSVPVVGEALRLFAQPADKALLLMSDVKNAAPD